MVFLQPAVSHDNCISDNPSSFDRVGERPDPYPKQLIQVIWDEGLNGSQTGMLPGIPESAICVQKFDDSLNSAIHTTYRNSLRSSSLREPRDPLSKVVFNFILFLKMKLQKNKLKHWFMIIAGKKGNSLTFLTKIHLRKFTRGLEFSFIQNRTSSYEKRNPLSVKKKN